MAAYPEFLPAPQVSGYGVETITGVSAVTFERGNTRQRRSIRRERHVFNLSLVLTMPDLWAWQSWANQYGYDWHTMNLQTHYAGLAGTTLLPHLVRYISDITIEPVGFDYVRVSLQAEMDANTLPGGLVDFTGNWYLGGTPAAPSSSNWVLGGTPASPSVNFIVAGSPGNPAA